MVDEFCDAPLIFVKDPRICRFIPFTLSVLSDLNISPVAILPLRNPLEVVYSLKRNRGFALSKSFLLWLRHVLDAEYHSRHLPRYFLHYEEFLTDWRGYVDRAADKMGVVWPARSDISDLKVEQFLTRDLRRERASVDEIKHHPEVPSMVRETYQILSEIAQSGESPRLLDRLDRVRLAFDEGCRMFGPIVWAEETAAEQLRRELNEKAAESEQFGREKTNLAAELAQRSLEVNRLAAELHSLAETHKVLTTERDGLFIEVNRLTAEQHSSAEARKALTAERDSLAAANNQLIAVHDAILASSSWRVTAPFRSLRKLLSRIHN
jgi:hypothetical protein